MKIKLFGKNIEPACAHCCHGRLNDEGDKVFCLKKGVVDAFKSCKSYKYDPLKRIPKKQNLSHDLTEKDFEL